MIGYLKDVLDALRGGDEDNEITFTFKQAKVTAQVTEIIIYGRIIEITDGETGVATVFRAKDLIQFEYHSE